MKSIRGNYRQSEEAAAYSDRLQQLEKIQQILDGKGCLSFGKYKGVTVHKVPAQYISWASENVPGFKEAVKSSS